MSTYESGVRQIIDDFLLEEAKKRRDYGDYWSASSAGYCMRKNIFDRMHIPLVTDDPRKQRVFTSGHVFHEWIQKLTKEAGVSLAQEIELQDDQLMILGHADDLIKTNDGIILYDYKTVSSRSFNYSRTSMSRYHRMQLGTYMYMLRNAGIPGGFSQDQLDLDITEGRILKISKDDLRMAENILHWSEGLEKEVVDYWRTLNGYWDKKMLPRCTCADYENGFMAKEQFNPYYYDGEPCSLKWYEMHKETEHETVQA